MNCAKLHTVLLKKLTLWAGEQKLSNNQSHTITTKDICGALAIKKHRLRGWVDRLIPYNGIAVRPKSARQYTSLDLLFFAIIKELEDNYGLKLSFIEHFSEQLHGLLEKPSLANRHKLFFISVLDKTITVLEYDEQPAQAGFIVNVEPAWELVTVYFGFASQQKSLPFGLIAVNDRKSSLTQKDKL